MGLPPVVPGNNRTNTTNYLPTTVSSGLDNVTVTDSSDNVTISSLIDNVTINNVLGNVTINNVLENVTLISDFDNVTAGNVTDTVSVAPDMDYQEMLAWILICSFFMIVGISLATGMYFWDQRNLPEHVKERKNRAITERRKKEEKAIAAIKKEPIQVDQFLQKLRQKKLDKYLTFEVRAIVRNQEEFPCTIALHPDNVSRNICQDVVSYDHCLLTLEHKPSEDDSYYINATSIEGYDGEKEYIATQGPRGKTVPAFWHLVWQENVQCIVMATGLFENAAQQCDKYWGDILSVQKYVRHGDVHIYLKDKLELAKLTIRTFHIFKDGCDRKRIVKHFEMIGFTDESTDPGFLLDVRRRVRRHMATCSGPMLVHCRCGGGRTAVFLAIDYCLNQLDGEGFVDIYSTVLHLRKFRQNMVRSLAQYRLIYDTVALYVQIWNTVIPASQLPATTHKLMMRDPQTQLTGFEKEFQTLQDIVPKIAIGDCASGHRDENRSKSRDIMLLPPERARPYLQTMETNDSGTDFVNAVYVDGYKQNNSYIATQWPMPGTINDIWRLLLDCKINSLVVLHENKCTRGMPCFWPKVLDEEVKYGPIGVKYLGCQKYPHIIIRAFSIRKKATGVPLLELLTKTNESVVVKMFHYTSWHHRDKVPSSTKSFLYMMGCVDEWQKNCNSTSPICVMSKDGYSRCGLYCTLSFACEQLHCEGEVDILGAVRIVKRNRPQLITTVEEYIYCYTYMSLVVSLMQEDSPKILVTSPSVIEGEIQQGYELLTGFENILSPKQREEKNYHKSGHRLTDANASASHALCDSRSSSCNGINILDGNMPTSASERNMASSHFRHKYNSRSSYSMGHLKENGYLIDGDSRHAQKDVNVVIAPKAPGHVWSPNKDANFNNQFNPFASGPERPRLYRLPRQPTDSKRPQLFRQNAEELLDLNLDPVSEQQHRLLSTSDL